MHGGPDTVASALSSQALRIAYKLEAAGGWAEPYEPAGREKRRPERAIAERNGGRHARRNRAALPPARRAALPSCGRAVSGRRMRCEGTGPSLWLGSSESGAAHARKVRRGIAR
jgi:hypothetical protein